MRLQCRCTVLTRDEWKSILYKQVSERRASERKAIEEATKLDNEEFSPAESEAELTDEESLDFNYGKEKTEKVMDEEIDEKISKENDHSAEVSQSGWHSDSDCSFSDDDNVEDNGDDIEGDEENSDDEIIVKNKKTTKQLESDSDSEMPPQSTHKPTSPVIRNFPFGKESTDFNQTSNLNDTVVSKENMSCEDGDKKVVDSGVGTSLLVSKPLDVDNSTVESNPTKVDNVTLIESIISKRPNEDDTNLVSIYYLLIQYFIFNYCVALVL